MYSLFVEDVLVKKQVNLQLSGKASARVAKLSKQLGLSCDDFASLCFEYVDIKHQGIVCAANKLREQKAQSAIHKKDLSKHLKQLSASQIELLLMKATQKKKN
jgi:DNA-binding MarR family transcriptional regulator